MRIDPKVIVSPVSVVDEKPHTPARGSEPPGHARGASIVSLSRAAANVAANNMPEHVAERIEQLRAMIASGEYTVDLDQLAMRVVDDDMVRTEKRS